MLRRLALVALLTLSPSLALAGEPLAILAPTAPTAANNYQIANTSWVRQFIAGGSIVLVSGTGHGDSAYAILSTDRYVYTNAAFTAPRIWTLPAANSLAAGTTIWVQDAQGTITTTNTLTVQRAGADTVNVAGTNIVMTGAGGGTQFTTDGVSNWGTAVQTVTTGGTGRQTLTNHGVLVGAGTNPLTQLAVGANGQLLLGATGADPAFAAMSQDATITAAGVITVTKTNNVAFAASATTDTTNAANISSGLLPGARLGTSAGSWTPTDASGASLVFTGVSAGWTQIGNMVFAYAGLTYPVTANGSNALIGGLPVTVPNTEYARQCSLTSASTSSFGEVLPSNGTTQLSPRNFARANIANSVLSGVTMNFICIYPAT